MILCSNHQDKSTEEHMALHWSIHTVRTQWSTMGVLVLSITLFLCCPTSCYRKHKTDTLPVSDITKTTPTPQNTTETVPVSHITKTTATPTRPSIPKPRPTCIRVKENVKIDTPEGCEPYTLRIPICKGTCLTETYIVSEPPYVKQDSQCCSALKKKYTIRKRTLRGVVCYREGRIVLETHVVHIGIPNINGCGCTAAQIVSPTPAHENN